MKDSVTARTIWIAADGDWVWAFLREEQAGRTHLRNWYRLPTLVKLLMIPASYVMERKMLRGIKRRAETLRPSRPSPRSVQADAPPASKGSSAAHGT